MIICRKMYAVVVYMSLVLCTTLGIQTTENSPFADKEQSFSNSTERSDDSFAFNQNEMLSSTKGNDDQTLVQSTNSANDGSSGVTGVSVANLNSSFGHNMANSTEPSIQDINAVSKDNVKSKDSITALIKRVNFILNVCVLPTFCISGIVGNTVVSSVFYEKRSSNSSFIYMFCLLVADILSLISDLFVTCGLVIENVASRTFLRNIGTEMAHWNGALVSYSFRCTALNILCVLSVERLIAIRRPLKLRHSLTYRFPRALVFLSFIVGCFAHFTKPINISFESVNINGTNITSFIPMRSRYYQSNKEIMDPIFIVQRLLTGPIQIVICSIMNGLIIHGMNVSRKEILLLDGLAKDLQLKARTTQLMLCKVFITVCVLHLLAFLPNSVMFIVSRLFPEAGLQDLTSYTAWIVGDSGDMIRIINSASEFLVIMVTASDIRNAVFQKMHIGKKK